MTYHRGTLAEFDAWHQTAMVQESISPEGKVGFNSGQLAPQNQRTTAYSDPIPHSSNSDDYIWSYGAYPHAVKEKLSMDDVISLGWFPDEDIE